jgi:type III pantothenate kinase
MTGLLNSILAIDAGNTRVKWGLFDQSGNLLEQGVCMHAELPNLLLPTANEAMISNVAGNAIETQLKKSLANTVKIHWVTSQASACGVKNGYMKPETLGTDRWVALIAAWHIKHAPCVVVNAGTAVTIDALTGDGEFIGGMILPGLDLMQQSLGLATAQLPTLCAPQTQDSSIFANNTADAIHVGALHAISGAINQMAHALQSHSKQVPAVIISGGNADAIKKHLPSDVTKQVLIVDNLVLQGLYLLKNFTQSDSR